ncbi:unnamed protein product [Oikopleura dioica]|uniref:Uncharacterized protein n=1 Tax=Oikopleura dioica TaxID=34765 RepID=E4YZP6_OIKDI|nr:unnamed protein product [Oikopleura dioica]
MKKSSVTKRYTMDSDLDWVLENDNGTYSELSPSEEIDGDVDTDPGFQTDCDSVLRTSRIYDALYEQDIYVPEVALQRRSARTPPNTIMKNMFNMTFQQFLDGEKI